MLLPCHSALFLTKHSTVQLSLQAGDPARPEEVVGDTSGSEMEEEPAGKRVRTCALPLRSNAPCCPGQFHDGSHSKRSCTAPAWHAASSHSQAQAAQVLPSHAWPFDVLPAESHAHGIIFALLH